MQETIIIQSKREKVWMIFPTIIALIGLVSAVEYIYTDICWIKKGVVVYDNYSHCLWGIVLALPFVLIALFIWWWFKKYELTVTNHRVYGKAAFGRRVDLPMDSISSVGTCFFKGILVATSSGAIKFRLIKNRDEIHSELSKLLISRQGGGKDEIVEDNNIVSVSALKEYKELLDSGIISQEEFDAKKKQILGL